MKKHQSETEKLEK